MEVDEETKAKLEKVIYVSSSSFVEPMEMPYLHIPAVSVLLGVAVCFNFLSTFESTVIVCCCDCLFNYFILTHITHDTT